LARIGGIYCHWTRLTRYTRVDLAAPGIHRKLDNVALWHTFLRRCRGVSRMGRANNKIPILLRRRKQSVGELFCFHIALCMGISRRRGHSRWLHRTGWSRRLPLHHENTTEARGNNNAYFVIHREPSSMLSRNKSSSGVKGNAEDEIGRAH